MKTHPMSVFNVGSDHKVKEIGKNQFLPHMIPPLV